MKKNIYLLLTLCIFACSPQEDDLFEDSAANRLTRAVSEYTTLLEGSENGWAMEFFPGDLTMGGIAYTVKFKNGNVEMRCEENINDVDSIVKSGQKYNSLYSVKSEQSIILSFDTYNPLIHYYSEPKSSSDVDGYASDYEFVFQGVNQTKDSVYLKGKRYGNELVLVRLKSDAKEYIENIHKVDTAVAMVPRTKLIIENTIYPISIHDNLMTVELKDSSVTIPYVYNDNGFRLYKPLRVNDISISNFIYNSNNGNIETSLDNKKYIPYPTKMEQFLGAKHPWSFIFDLITETGEMNDELFNLFMSNRHFSSYQIVERWAIGPDPLYADGYADHAMAIQYGINFFNFMIQYAYYGIVMTSNDDITLEVKTGGAAANYNFYASSLDPTKDYLISNSPYIVTFNDGLNATSAHFESINNKNIWFNLKLDESR